ncbi:hypothetical protein JZU71_02200, partial [bacterium]|nr:hypothetical protein [bacterium]
SSDGVTHPVGKTRWEIAADFNDEPEKWHEHIKALNNHKPFYDFTYKTKLDDGSESYVRSTGKPLFDEARNFIGYRGVSSDVTEI